MPETAYTRTDDPLSSHIAAATVNVSKDELYVLELVSRLPGNTAKELDFIADNGRPHRRMFGLWNKGLVTREAVGKSRELRCTITDAGRKALKG